MSAPIDEAILYVLRCGPSAYRTDPELLAGPDAKGIRNRIARLSRRIEAEPILGLRMWNKHAEELRGLPITRDWYYPRTFGYGDDED